jgi:hypothetical protein
MADGKITKHETIIYTHHNKENKIRRDKNTYHTSYTYTHSAQI